MSALHIPVFLGVSGKRTLDPDPARSRQLTAVVERRFDAVLDHLDKKFSGVVKVLLSGGAAGVDLLAARRVLGLDGAAPRPDWLVTLVLPFEPKLFREDFADAAEWGRLEEIIDHPRVRHTILPRLRTALAPPAGFDPAIDPLSRANQAPEWRDLRRRHYEQVGLWIDDNANILLAIMNHDERAERIGGTARIVAYRRGGRPDAVANEVIAVSEAPLAPHPPLVRPPQQYVWLLDPAADKDNEALPVDILPPIVEREAVRVAYNNPAHGAVPARRKDHLGDSLAGARTIQRLDALAERGDLAGWPREECPAGVVKGIRDAQREVRSRNSRLSAASFRLLGALFVLAVLAFETFVKFFHHDWRGLLPYALLFVLIISLYRWAQYRRWQPDKEDSRAVAELLRVQYAWWRAGIGLRVDHIHLQGADKDLARVREAARSAIVWARLVAREQPAKADWSEVWVPEPAGAPAQRRRDWIGEQRDYFHTQEDVREHQATRVNALSWVLFATSVLLVAHLMIWLRLESLHPPIDAAVGRAMAEGPRGVALAFFAGIVLALSAWGLRLVASGGEGPRLILTFILGGVAAAGLAWSSRMGGEWLATWLPETTEEYTKHLLIIAVVVLPAIAGAIRFVSEKLAYEAEALRYREALRWFEHADELLARRPPGRGNADDDGSARAVVEQLGRLALSESEAWLKAHRERPLSPVIGG